MSFKPGDVVQLKSGGEKMTVRCVVGDGTDKEVEEPFRLSGAKDGYVLCQWIDKSKKPQAQAYPEHMLVHAGQAGILLTKRT